PPITCLPAPLPHNKSGIPPGPPRFFLNHPPPPRGGEGGGGGKPLQVALVIAALLFGGCSMSKWTVKPHQRELLADKIMQLDADPQEREAEEHVLANREGAIGGTGTSGGGCGC